MKEAILCASQASTAVCMSMDPGTSSAIQLGGKAIDRHNPIITDERRSSRGLPTPPSSPHGTPQKSDKSPSKSKKDYKKTCTQKNKITGEPVVNDTIKKSVFKPADIISRSCIKPGVYSTPAGSSRYLLGDAAYFDGLSDSDHPVLVSIPVEESQKTVAVNQLEDSIQADKTSAVRHHGAQVKSRKTIALNRHEAPVEHENSVALNQEHIQFEDKMIQAIGPYESNTENLSSSSGFSKTFDANKQNEVPVEVEPKKVEALNEENVQVETKKTQATEHYQSDNNNLSSSNQVVVLRVSLHCRGCVGKVKKHLSKMQGVTSFNIDFAAKKVTVVGDVTPLEVIASISKVKTAQFWPPAESTGTKEVKK